MQFIDLQAQYRRIKADVDARIQAVLDHGRFVAGPEIQTLEDRLAAYVGVAHCVALSSGSDALRVALMALDIGPGDEVITTPFTFIATAEAIALLGATPVFADIDADTYNIDAGRIAAQITARTRAIVAVSLFGQTADMDAINALADEYGVAVIEDAAQSFGATYQGQRSCGLSQMAITSFFPAKPLGCYGDGGAAFTDDAGLAQRLRELCNHGVSAPDHHPRLGINGRLDTLQAAVLLAKLAVFDDEIDRRVQAAARYDEHLAGLVKTPTIAAGRTSVYAQYTIEVTARDRVRAGLRGAAIPSAVYYPIPLNRQPPLFCQAALPVAEAAAQRVLSLPMHPYLADQDQRRVCDAIAAVIQK